MKKSLLSTLFLLAFAYLCQAQIPVSGLMEEVKNEILKIEQGVGGYTKGQVIFIRIDNIVKGNVDVISYKLKAGNVYKLIAIGDGNRIKDIDLMLYGLDGELLESETNPGRTAIITRVTKVEKDVEIKVIATEMKNQKADGFYGLIVYRLLE